MDLSTLTDDELTALQYEKEKSYADRIRGSAPFSEERAAITSEAYAEIAHFVDERCRRSGAVHTYGADRRSVSLIKSAVDYLRSQNAADRVDLNFYEAGVGTGFVINSLDEDQRLHIYGCDVYLTEELKTKFPKLHESTIIQSLRALLDHFIDIFYWDNVMEHMPADEIDTLLRLFARKCKHNGLIITITPSAYTGPHDITRFADPLSREAHGLHLKEYALKDVLRKYSRTGWTPAGRAKGDRFVFSNVRFYYFSHILAEKLFHNHVISRLIPSKIRRRFYYINITVARPRES